jgi:hypothetical protein
LGKEKGMSQSGLDGVALEGAGGREHAGDGTVEIILDGVNVTSPSRKRTGLQIRELGPADRVNGFETQEIDAHGKKIRTIRDDDVIELHKDERFRTVPNHGGPGDAAL